MIDIEAVRADTPGCRHVIHFNNAGASLMPDPVFAAVVEHLELERNIGGYEAAKQASGELEQFYTNFARLLGAQPDEIAYVENATRAWDMAFYSLPLGKGDRVLTHDSEYVSNYLALLQQAQRRGFEIDLVPSDAHGQVDVDAMADMIRPATKLIALTHVPTQGGLVNPAAAVGRLAREHGLFYLLDACQSVGQLPLDVKELGCHMLSGTGRKFLRGPRGTGFLYVSREVTEQLDPPFIDLHSALWTKEQSFEFLPGAKRFENWECYVAGRLGLARAVRYALDIGIEAIEQRVKALATRLRARLGELPDLTVHDLGEETCGIVTFRCASEPAGDVAARLHAAGINVSTTTRAAARLDFGRRDLDQLVRASVHYYNTENEIDRFIEMFAG